MSQTVSAGAPYSSRLALGTSNTGLAGTVRFRLLNNNRTPDDPVYGPSTAGIIEDPTGSGSYVFDGTAPAVSGNYARAWDMGIGTELVYDEDLLVSSDTLVPFVPTGHEYVTSEELKTILGRQNQTFEDEAIAVAVEAASRACDGYKSTRFYAADETRYYTPSRYESEVPLDDLASLTSVTVDMDGDGVYETTWVEGTNFVLDPANAIVDGQPQRTLVLLRQSNTHFPRFLRGIKVQGSFGWGATPTLVKEATILLANRLLTRVGQAPLGILVAAAGDAVTTARLGRIDPDAAFLLDQIPGLKAPPLVSIQLG